MGMDVVIPSEKRIATIVFFKDITPSSGKKMDFVEKTVYEYGYKFEIDL